MSEGTLSFTLRLNLLDWEGWALGRTEKAAWKAWARGPAGLPPALAGAKGPSPDSVPPALRRRAGVSDRLALEVALRLAPVGTSLPSVFASRHGQIQRSVALLETLAKGETLSPLDFSVSVHNASAGLASMVRQDRSPSTAVAAGRESLTAALLEAQGLVLEGAEKVLVVYHEEAPPAVLDGAWEPEAADWSMGLLVGREGGVPLDLSLEDEPGRLGEEAVPQAWALARLVASGKGRTQWRSGRRCWTWELGS